MSEQILLLPYYQKGYIYLIENIQNRKKYIGKTSDENPEKYIKNHFSNALKNKDLKENKKGKRFYNAIRKYGVQNFKWKILGEIYGLTYKELNDNLNVAEIACIYHFRTFGADGIHKDEIYGYNMTIGGDGIRLCGKNNGMYGRNDQCYGENRIVTKAKNNIGKKYEEIFGEIKAKLIKEKIKNNNLLKDKTWEEFYGIEKANKKKQNLSIKNSKPKKVINHPRRIYIDHKLLTEFVLLGLKFNEIFEQLKTLNIKCGKRTLRRELLEIGLLEKTYKKFGPPKGTIPGNKGKQHSQETKKLMSAKHKNKKWVNKDTFSKLVNFEDLNFYLNNGWMMGRIKKW